MEYFTALDNEAMCEQMMGAADPHLAEQVLQVLLEESRDSGTLSPVQTCGWPILGVLSRSSRWALSIKNLGVMEAIAAQVDQLDSLDSDGDFTNPSTTMRGSAN